MPNEKTPGRGRGKIGRRTTREDSPPTFLQRAKATLGHVRFSAGVSAGPLRLSPRLSRKQRRELEFWIRRMQAPFESRLPRLKLAAADQLNLARKSIFINENPPPQEDRHREHTHAVSFIRERYIVLDAGLFRRRVELGRILYHELCHFIWPRLGNPKRRRFAALIGREFREQVRGELGYSSEYRKARLSAHTGVPDRRTAGWGGESAGRGARKKSPATPSSRPLQWRDYVCESFCDTGSFVLLGRERRKRHSEYTLSQTARKRRSRIWSQVVLENAAGPGSRLPRPAAAVGKRKSC